MQLFKLNLFGWIFYPFTFQSVEIFYVKYMFDISVHSPNVIYVFLIIYINSFYIRY